MTGDEGDHHRQAVHRHLAVALGAVALLVGGIAGWAATMPLSSAVIGPGRVVVDSSAKSVQHPTGGVIGSIKVRDGDRVAAGDVLVQLDPTQVKANLAIVSHNLDELVARRARLEAEADGRDAPTFPSALLARAEAEQQGGRDDPGADPDLPSRELAQVIAGEIRLFALRRTAHEGKKAQLREQITQMEHQTRGLQTQLDANATEIILIGRELEAMRSLSEKKLVTLERVIARERDAARLKGDQGRLTASIAQSRTKASELQLALIQLDQDLHSEAASGLRELAAKIAELRERKVAATDQAARIEIRAPQGGIVHQLAVHTPGGVVSAGDTLMLIVPDDDVLKVEARIAPQDVDEIQAGAAARVRFPAFASATTPELSGTLVTLSPDVATDQRTGATHYIARVTLDEDALSGLGPSFRLVPGMPAEVFIDTGTQTALAYLMKPVRDHLQRAWRER
ncbi:HlyD family type I secretion periplasmic adaptor subunit [Xanthobacter autotrophicus]|uniref:HlyD family type I secretion periplasmic adaptor subunit n=1 Tax=Xanthobacter autotrophicus TaxID=280 RepID=UPI00372BF990